MRFLLPPAALAPLLLLAACPADPGDDDTGTDDDDASWGPLARLTSGDEVPCEAPDGPGFTDVTGPSNLGYAPAAPTVEEMQETRDVPGGSVLGGFAVGDFDGDGHLDVVATDLEAPIRYFTGDGRMLFSEQNAEDLGLATAGSRQLGGASTADYDGDGDLDLFVGTFGANFLFRNDGGRFTDVTDRSGVAGGNVITTTGSWADYDGDGDLDLYVANNVERPEGQFTGDPARDHVYRNDGDDVFTDVTDEVLPTDAHGVCFLGMWFDADEDGRVDLLVGNASSAGLPEREVNRFLHNEGGGRYRPAREFHLDVAVMTMGGALGDYDNDGDIDLHLTNAGPSFLARNDGASGFTDVSLDIADLSAGPRGDIGWASEFFDYDNDGDLELFTAFGAEAVKLGAGPNDTANPLEQHDTLWERDAAGAWHDIAPELGVDSPDMTRTAAAVDLNRDGFLDLITWGIAGGFSIHQGLCTDSNWLGVQLEDPTSVNRNAVGARVEVWDGDAFFATREVYAGSTGVYSGGPPEVHFGLGELEVARVVVRWPDGTVTDNPDVTGRRWITLSP